MANLPFNKNFSDLAEQAVAKGQPLNAGTLGPYAAIGPSQDNPWMSAYAQQPDAATFSRQGFNNDVADQVLAKIQSIGPQASRTDSNSQNWGTGFLSKYLVNNGLVPQKQKITQGTIAAVQAQQPADFNPAGTLAAGKMNYPGASGTKIG
jgi:hypothetical protein